ncbi:MAG: DUF2103 domain-containing protein [Candidatus Magasanikbacteria bacterium]
MPHFSGDKITSSHSTIISASKPIVKRLNKDPRVSKISLGRIDKSGSGSGSKRAKIIDESGCILIEVSHSGSFQAIRAFSEKGESLKKSLASFLKEEDYEVDFHDRRT